MASIGNAYKIAAAVMQAASGNGTLYTVPANSYLLFNLNVSGATGGPILQIGGDVGFQPTGGVQNAQGLVAGPGQSIVIASNGSGNVFRISGVLFTNT